VSFKYTQLPANSVDVANKKAEMAFRTTEAQRKGTSGITLSDLKQGQKVDGVVKKIEEYGFFIQIDGSKLSGLCHKSQVGETFDSSIMVLIFLLLL
jgi:rRNA biogenesis protein RRP5